MALPPHAFVPGCGVRPDDSGACDHPVVPDNWSTHALYQHGVDLYNHGYFWEAHEAWESLWHLCPRASGERLLLQGLIQLAAAHLKRRQLDLLRGSRLVHSAVARLRTAASLSGDPLLGIDVERLCQAATEHAIARDLCPWPLLRLRFPAPDPTGSSG